MDISSFKLTNLQNVYAIGLIDNLITIYSQQIRAICFARELTNAVENNSAQKNGICIVGGGISGLTCALELLENGWSDITIIERMPDLLGVQNGCDTRWVHPNIINWPDPGSDVEESDNGVLDWEASTASNVTYQIEKAWMLRVKEILGQNFKGRPDRILSVHVGVTYIHAKVVNAEVEIEWIRDAKVRPIGFKGSKTCNSEKRMYSHVVFATGFGVEQTSKHSYWRNEGYGQLHIDGLQRSYIVSGLGDGAISDLLRLTTKHFRPDRVISEVKQLNFLRDSLRQIKAKSMVNGFDLINEFIASSSKKGEDGKSWRELIDNFGSLHREDTKVFLYHNSPDGFSHAFNNSPASFFNKLLLFVLYRNGAFQYIDKSTCDEIYDFADKNNVMRANVILRHGVDRCEIIEHILQQNPGEVSTMLQPYEECKAYVKATRRGIVISAVAEQE